MIRYWIIIIMASLYIVLAVGAMVWIIRRGLLMHLHHKRQEKVSLRAKVKHKVDAQGFHGVDWQIGTVQHIIVFECEDGEERNFDVAEAVWDATEEGDTGTLTFQGPHVLDFHSHHHHRRRHADAAYERLTRR